MLTIRLRKNVTVNLKLKLYKFENFNPYGDSKLWYPNG